MCFFNIETHEIKKNIVLIGMMGSGKSSIGKILSKKLNLDFIDIDEKIEKSEENTISNIFLKKGESYFRKIEQNITINYLKLENKIISLGGGGYINLQIRKQCSKIVQHSGSIGTTKP